MTLIIIINANSDKENLYENYLGRQKKKPANLKMKIQKFVDKWQDILEDKWITKTTDN